MPPVQDSSSRLEGPACPTGKKTLANFVTMAMWVNDKVKCMKVKLGGQEKVDEFRNKVRRAFGLPDILDI